MKSLFSVVSLFCFFGSLGQGAYKEGDVIQDFKAPRLLNSPAKTGSFAGLKKDITIIDFFGTWCMPCIKALPVLDRIQNNHLSGVAVVLVSTEKEAQLNKFISTHTELTFPFIVDEGGMINNLFQPPSYPYTVVLNSSNQIIAITEASALTEEKIIGWLAQKPALQNSGNTKNTTSAQNNMSVIENPVRSPAAQLSAEFIYAAKTGNETGELQAKLANMNFDALQNDLRTDDDKKAFWINVYNGFTQLLLKKDPGKYKNRNTFFKMKQIAIAGKMFSLDEIEHDILRRSKIKWSLGYLSKIFPSATMRSLRVEHPDYRVHFALNCGAKSCPPIAFYDPSNVETQLDIATGAYLTGEADYEPAKNALKLPAIMGWFRRDFKGKKNMLQLVKKYKNCTWGKTTFHFFQKI